MCRELETSRREYEVVYDLKKYTNLRCADFSNFTEPLALYRCDTVQQMFDSSFIYARFKPLIT